MFDTNTYNMLKSSSRPTNNQHCEGSTKVFLKSTKGLGLLSNIVYKSIYFNWLKFVITSCFKS